MGAPSLGSAPEAHSGTTSATIIPGAQRQGGAQHEALREALRSPAALPAAEKRKAGALTGDRLELQEGGGQAAAQHLVLSRCPLCVPAAPHPHHLPVVHAVARGQRHLQPKKSRCDFKDEQKTRPSRSAPPPTLW